MCLVWRVLCDLMVQVISSDLVMDCDESVVFDAAARWLLAKTDALSRRKYAPEVRVVMSGVM